MILVYTGGGKGKTTAALGAAFRAIGHGQRVLMIQFFKGDWPVTYGEIEAAKKLPEFDILQIGKGFVGIMGDKKPVAEHRTAAREALDRAKAEIVSGKYGLVILDEINVAVDLGLVEPSEAAALFDGRPENTNLIFTGRNARPEIVERADLVTEMREVKHPFQKGVQAQKGIDY